MTPSPTDVVDWLSGIALASDHPRADWLAEVAALMRNGTPFDQAVGWAGFAPVLRHHAQMEALVALVAAMAPGTVTAEAVHRRLTAPRPQGPAVAYLKAHGPTGLRSVHRRLADLRAANALVDLAGATAA